MSKVDFHRQGKVAAVAGAAQSIGAACAGRPARDGAAAAPSDIDDARGAQRARALAAGTLAAELARAAVPTGDEAQDGLPDPRLDTNQPIAARRRAASGGGVQPGLQAGRAAAAPPASEKAR
jgi:NAD(P)-dependent dehydrogenase (short-subunit alcohol dehydrogenase family)